MFLPSGYGFYSSNGSLQKS